MTTTKLWLRIDRNDNALGLEIVDGAPEDEWAYWPGLLMSKTNSAAPVAKWEKECLTALPKLGPRHRKILLEALTLWKLGARMTIDEAVAKYKGRLRFNEFGVDS